MCLLFREGQICSGCDSNWPLHLINYLQLFWLHVCQFFQDKNIFNIVKQRKQYLTSMFKRWVTMETDFRKILIGKYTKIEECIKLFSILTLDQLTGSNIVTVLWREEGFTMKYCLSPREIPRTDSEGFPKGSGNISLYTQTGITIQSFSITSTSQYFMKDQW